MRSATLHNLNKSFEVINVVSVHFKQAIQQEKSKDPLAATTRYFSLVMLIDSAVFAAILLFSMSLAIL